ncbi:Rieske 2Fe-2S domain-containing protein [Azoarcus indigens]|uniref:Rieske Fe-S protein n=1 Tax=Azoarcus indigens TaxID=29545 RepID=A0A4R6EFV6_9RHOO|nr:Rieske 2Fe-2S domain-containing protein [Azoarcus indigens]NMG67354.1 Rieske 2Fe-2S domain-containing protein [Azoarcus indigens]TDN57175.1 Rieske Fe-S protein [Azoarcus indigens]
MADRELEAGCPCANAPQAEPGSRRAMLAASLALAVAPLVPGGAAAADNPRRARPQVGDGLAYMTGEKEGQQITLADLKVGGPPVLAYPMDVSTQTVRDGARTNLLALVKVAPEELPEKLRADAADGVLAFSAICTHYGCPITETHPTGGKLVCNCHGSTFDVLKNGEVVAGPATRRLAHLPLKQAGSALLVAGNFAGPLGPPQQ